MFLHTSLYGDSENVINLDVKREKKTKTARTQNYCSGGSAKLLFGESHG